jgi:hypothetical protein
LIAATATFALNAGLWFRRGRLAMVFSLLAASCRCCTENPLIPAVQIAEIDPASECVAEICFLADELQHAFYAYREVAGAASTAADKWAAA